MGPGGKQLLRAALVSTGREKTGSNERRAFFGLCLRVRELNAKGGAGARPRGWVPSVRLTHILAGSLSLLLEAILLV